MIHSVDDILIFLSIYPHLLLSAQVRACLRVLKHHGVIDMVDMFVYSNRYEFTAKATAMLAGKESTLLHEAVDFVLKKPASSSMNGSGRGVYGDSNSEQTQGGSPYHHSSFTPSSSYPPRTLNLLGGSQRSSNFRYAMMLTNSLENDSSLSRREDPKRTKLAVAELYTLCNRNICFGDLWLALISEQTSQQKAESNRKTSIGEESTDRDTSIDFLAFSPIETNHLEVFRKSISDSNVEWDDFFQRFDHRRFFSFGLVHNLVRRVHEYPYYPGIFPARKVKYKQTSTDSKQQNSKSYTIEGKLYLLARDIASLMDGTRCDDEFVCIFEKPYKQLVEMVEKFSGKKVVSLLMAS
jgi:hypothetical protein